MQLPACFRVATLNILHDPPELSWPQRAPLVAAGFRALGADIIVLQEVAWPDEQASDFAEALSASSAIHFAAWITPLITPHGWQESLALLTRYPVLEHAALRYPDAEQFCQRVRLDLGGRAIDVYNAHLDPYSADRRLSQVESILQQMRSQTGVAGSILGGDLNATPRSEEISLLRPSLHSAHASVHGREPTGTYPTPFRRSSAIPNQTLDYLWCSSTLTVLNCQTIFGQPAPHDSRLFASDHVGLAAELCLAKDGEQRPAIADSS